MNIVSLFIPAVSRPDSSSFPVLMIVGLVCGIVLVIALLVLFCYRTSKGETFFFCYYMFLNYSNAHTYSELMRENSCITTI